MEGGLPWAGGETVAVKAREASPSFPSPPSASFRPHILPRLNCQHSTPRDDPQIQYPGAAGTMQADLVNLRAAARFLQRTELQFDLVSAVDELHSQV